MNPGRTLDEQIALQRQYDIMRAAKAGDRIELVKGMAIAGVTEAFITARSGDVIMVDVVVDGETVTAERYVSEIASITKAGPLEDQFGPTDPADDAIYLARQMAANMCRAAKWTPHVCDDIANGEHDDYVIVKACLMIGELEDQLLDAEMRAVDTDTLR